MAEANFVIVDDTNPAIKYSAGWTFNGNADTPLGNTGAPLYKTLYEATSQTKFTFTYNGAFGSLFVVGSILSDSPPSWNCTVDNKPIPTFQPQGQTNHFQICGTTAGPGITGDHTLQVNVNASEESPAAFDYILYTPAPKVRPGDLVFDSNNAQIQYSQHWASTSLGQVTSSTGEKLEFDFNGHSLTWFGFFNGNLPSGQATATYSLDGLEPVTFLLDNSVAGPSEQTDQLFFQTRLLSPGHHHLEVVFQGSNQGIPLSLSRLVVQNNTAVVGFQPVIFPSDGLDANSIPTASSISSTLPTPFQSMVITASASMAGPSGKPSPSATNGTTKSSLPPGVIVGSTVAVVAVVICIAILIRRRMLRNTGDAPQARSRRPEPFHHHPLLESNRSLEKSLDGVSRTFTDVEQQSGFSRPSKTRRLVEATASVFRMSRWSVHVTSETTSGPTSSSRRPPRVVMHQDSGVRVPQPDEEPEVIEVPPAYGSI